ncbi:hypothetical protein LCGC14_1164940 [marine sediment metagenome]|uniref:Uncharacterized protein n=1 Tax=marine sediment metagenome TaxID=412755 RepID=A0A0F9MEI0_9ZZZZ
MPHIHRETFRSYLDGMAAYNDIEDIEMDMKDGFLNGLLVGIKMMVTHPDAGIFLYNDLVSNQSYSPPEQLDLDNDHAGHEMFCADPDCPIVEEPA